MNHRFCLLGIIFTSALLMILPPHAKTQKLSVSENGRFLENTSGQPFFYLGDTAWELFHRLSLSEARAYLQNRTDKGFTVIQAVVLSQVGGLDVPNANGDIPLLNEDPAQPNEAYFRHVDAIVDLADSLGLMVGMLPTWGSYWSYNDPENVIFTRENARSFGQFLGARYREKPIIWILGGDSNIHTPEERAVINAMARGLRAGDSGEHLITFHPRGPGRSSDYFHQTDWLDFNMFQSSHGAHDHDNGLFAAHDYALSPPKPTLDGEPRYERIENGFYFRGYNRLDRFDDDDCRQAAYLSVMSGACGHTYGHNSIWQMYAPGRDPIIGAVVPWYDALDHPGSFQMTHLRTLMESRPWQRMHPSQEMVLGTKARGDFEVKALLDKDRQFAFIYSAKGASFTVDKSRIEATRIKEIWFDPRYGVSYHIHTGDTQSIQTYTPPTSGQGQDWILILENAERQWSPPGHFKDD